MTSSQHFCLDCHSTNLIIPAEPHYFDTVTCKDCTAEFNYGKLRLAFDTREYEVPPIYGVQELNE